MTPRRLATLITVAILGLTASLGCGGDSEEEGPATPPATPATNPVEDTDETSAEKPAGGLTPIGSELKIGEAAVIKYEDTGGSGKKSNIEVTPKSIEKGTLDDFENVDLDADQKSSTPYYVEVTVKNVGSGDLSKTEPASYIDGVDDRDQEQNNVIFFGEFDRCDAADAPKSLKPGESYETCLVYLIPKGGSLAGMRWTAFDPNRPDEEDINWKQ